MAHSDEGVPHGTMGTPQTIVYGLPFQFGSCHGSLIRDQFVSSMKSMAYLMEPAEPSHLAAVSMPAASCSPS